MSDRFAGASRPPSFFPRGWASRRILVSGVLCLFLGLGSQIDPAYADEQDLLGEPAQASAETPGNLTVESQSLDSHTGSSHPLDAAVVGSRPLPTAVESESPVAQAQTGISPDDLTGEADRLSDLPDASEVEDQVNRQTWRQVEASQPAVARPRTLEEARSNLTRARARLGAARAAVGKMIRRDYPTGQPRVRIYDEERLAEQQVAEAEGWVRELGGSPESGAMP